MKKLVSKGRAIDYLRISLTDRCDLRCVYCMSADGISNKLTRDDVMSLEDVAQFARIACEEGIKYIRLTGGEPLVRLGIVDLVKELAQIPQLEDLSMTSNGQLFVKYADELKSAGLSRVTFSMDSTDPETYKKLSRGGDLQKVYEAIDRALELDYKPVKINALAYQLTDDDLREFMRMVKERPLHIRFIEHMPIGNLTMPDDEQSAALAPLMTTEQILSALNRLSSEQGLGTLEPLRQGYIPLGHGPASSLSFEGAQGSFGFIGIHSQDFCKDCNRLRFTADGKIRSCLFSDLEIPVYAALVTNNKDSIRASLYQAVASKPLSYAKQQGTKRAMSAIGG